MKPRTKSRTQTPPKAHTASIRENALNAARMARVITRQSLTDFVSDAVSAHATPILKRGAAQMAAGSVG